MPRRRRDRSARAPDPERSGSPRRRVVARAFIAAPREEVWRRVSARRPSLLLLDDVSPIRPERVDRIGVGTMRCAGDLAPLVNDEVVVWFPPERYGYRLAGWPLFREYSGQIILSDSPGGTTELTWIIEFAPGLPGTGRFTHAALDLLLECAVVRLKRNLEVIGRAPVAVSDTAARPRATAALVGADAPSQGACEGVQPRAGRTFRGR